MCVSISVSVSVFHCLWLSFNAFQCLSLSFIVFEIKRCVTDGVSELVTRSHNELSWIELLWAKKIRNPIVEYQLIFVCGHSYYKCLLLTPVMHILHISWIFKWQQLQKNNATKKRWEKRRWNSYTRVSCFPYLSKIFITYFAAIQWCAWMDK